MPGGVNEQIPAWYPVRRQNDEDAVQIAKSTKSDGSCLV
jgi:hypothetical protein